jgi:ADP-ribose pyrophosphatase YjhB (NUDIX family)
LRITAARAVHPKFTVSATGIVINDEREVLLLEHVLRPASGWALPGGFLEAAEQAESALRREIMEEAGLELENIHPYIANTSRSHVEIFFVASPIGSPAVRSREIIDCKWFRCETLPSDMSSVQQRLIRQVLQGQV